MIYFFRQSVTHKHMHKIIREHCFLNSKSDLLNSSLESPPFLLFIIRYKYVNRVISFSKVYVLLRNMIVRHTRYCILYIVTIFIGTPSEGITLILLRLNRDIYLQWFIVKPCSSEIKTLLARLCFSYSAHLCILILMHFRQGPEEYYSSGLRLSESTIMGETCFNIAVVNLFLWLM